ncbi:hypothetical protein BDW59DRAFT_99478 [Aspergillus cavernicola]|uniref:Uncharacterized protein n=1 Tax=Aspergillus cavernicola TaxID=176166 RepID=A0ABR4I8W2_9EURO
MKSSTLFTLLPLLSTTYAWTFTWVNADGEESTERGRGPSECIPVNHEQGEVFVADGQGEPNINMLLFTNDECSGEPAGQATEEFSKEASVDLLGFQVVSLGGSGAENGTNSTATGTETGTATTTEAETEVETQTGTEQLSSSSTDLSTSTETDSDSATPTPTATETDNATTTPTPTEPSTTDDEAEPTPTDAASNLVLSRNGLAGIALGLIAGGWAVDYLF